jgi:hypothetical protein
MPNLASESVEVNAEIGPNDSYGMGNGGLSDNVSVSITGVDVHSMDGLEEQESNRPRLASTTSALRR